MKYLEHIQVTLNLSFTRIGHLQVWLTSPMGTVSQILFYRRQDVLSNKLEDWTVLSVQFWGENPVGTWQLTMTNKHPHVQNTGKLSRIYFFV